MKNNYKFVLFVLFVIGVVLFAMWSLRGIEIPVLNPKGWIALRERRLFNIATLLMLIIVLPVIALTFAFAWIYRASNKEAKYTPDWDDNPVAEFIWWSIPTLIITILSVITWKGSHELDPFRPIQSPVKPIKIQVVALQWKWLFIYPEEKIATVNFMQFPVDTPVDLELTADAPMNSFWLPQLSGQVFAMPAMKTRLHLIANEEDLFSGSSANISGSGFAGMTFIAKSSSKEAYDEWVSSVKKENRGALDLKLYKKLAEPSSYDPIAVYMLEKQDLFDWIIMKYMMPMPEEEE